MALQPLWGVAVSVVLERRICVFDCFARKNLFGKRFVQHITNYSYSLIPGIEVEDWGGRKKFIDNQQVTEGRERERKREGGREGGREGETERGTATQTFVGQKGH
jgi:hypothetical protein